MTSPLTSSTSDSQSHEGRPRMVTRALVKGQTPQLSKEGGAPVGGVLRCLCQAYLTSTQETLLECGRCLNWCHPACVGVDHAELRQHQAARSYICPFCRGLYKRQRAAAAPVPRQLPQKLNEVPDRPPIGAVARLRELLRVMRRVAQQAGFEVIDIPTITGGGGNNNNNTGGDITLTEAVERECLECCADAIRDATFSEQYPSYCLKEVKAEGNRYVQGTLLRSLQTHRIVSLVLSNGMDVYGNLRPTIAQLKSGINRGLIDKKHQTVFMAECTKLTDISDFVHITLSATHRDFQRRGLAKILMCLDLLKWALRGRTRAYLNMALEKKIVDGGSRLECVPSPASQRLYESFGFKDVYPRYDRETDEFRWTPKEADMGRVMAHLNFVDDVITIATQYEKNLNKNTLSSTTTSTTTISGKVSNGEVNMSGVEISVNRSPSPPVVKRRLPLTGKRNLKKNNV